MSPRCGPCPARQKRRFRALRHDGRGGRVSVEVELHYTRTGLRRGSDPDARSSAWAGAPLHLPVIRQWCNRRGRRPCSARTFRRAGRQKCSRPADGVFSCKLARHARAPSSTRMRCSALPASSTRNACTSQPPRLAARPVNTATQTSTTLRRDTPSSACSDGRNLGPVVSTCFAQLRFQPAHRVPCPAQLLLELAFGPRQLTDRVGGLKLGPPPVARRSAADEGCLRADAGDRRRAGSARGAPL
jgi:hypothetical protein